MGGIHVWGPESRARITGGPIAAGTYYLELAATDDEVHVQTWWAAIKEVPAFVVAPHSFDSRTNSVIGANVRRMLPKDTLIAVMVHGKKRRERMDMTHWLIENEYLPMFPRYMPNAANPSVPLGRLQLLHEVRPILDRDPEQMFVCDNWKGTTTEAAAMEYMRGTGNSWELLS